MTEEVAGAQGFLAFLEITDCYADMGGRPGLRRWASRHLALPTQAYSAGLGQSGAGTRVRLAEPPGHPACHRPRRATGVGSSRLALSKTA
jgi:hypothetical protein